MTDQIIQPNDAILLLFLVIFTFFCITMSWFWQRYSDRSLQYPLPDLDKLTPFEIALLRDGYRGVIHIILFELWKAKRIRVFNNYFEIYVKSISRSSASFNTNIEALFFRFIANAKKRSFTELFKEKYLHSVLEKKIKPFNQRLVSLHLKKNRYQQDVAKKILWVNIFLIGLIGGGKILLNLNYHQPISLLIMSLIIMIGIIKLILIIISEEKTQLGEQYLETLEQSNSHSEIKTFFQRNPVWLVAIFGIEGLAFSSYYTPFRKAFTTTCWRWFYSDNKRAYGDCYDNMTYFSDRYRGSSDGGSGNGDGGGGG